MSCTASSSPQPTLTYLITFMSRKMERIVRVLSAMTIGRSPFFDVKRLRATSRAIAAGLSGAGRRYFLEPTTSKMGDQQLPLLTFASANHDDSQVGQPR